MIVHTLTTAGSSHRPPSTVFCPLSSVFYLLFFVVMF